MANLFDEEEGQFLTMRALRLLERPPEVQKEDDPFTLNGSLVMTFIIVSSVDEYRAGQGIKFQPFYVHQFFRESNEIYGYKDLTIKVYVTGVKLIPYIEIKYTELTEDADDLEAALNKLYESGYIKKEEEFLALLEEEQTKTPIGEEIESFGDCKIYRSQITTKGFVEYKPFLQSFLLLLIDGAQYPCDSENWIYYTLYEKNIFIGVTTVYKFQITSKVERHRLSQMLFLPTHQRKGLGSKMLRTIYRICQEDENCKQITLEDPSDDFQLMRDITDCIILRPYFSEFNEKKVITNPNDLVDLSKEKLMELMGKTKLYSTQIRRAYQLFQYSLISKNARNTLVHFGQEVIKGFSKPYTRTKNILVRFEDGKGLNGKQLHLLEMKEKEDRNIDYADLLLEEFQFFELISQKLRKERLM